MMDFEPAYMFLPHVFFFNTHFGRQKCWLNESHLPSDGLTIFQKPLRTAQRLAVCVWRLRDPSSFFRIIDKGLVGLNGTYLGW